MQIWAVANQKGGVGKTTTSLALGRALCLRNKRVLLIDLDPHASLTRAFGVHIEEAGLALRGTFVIDPQGVIKTMEVHDNAIARDVTETVRKLKAAQYVASHPNEVCPAKWKEGEATLAPSIDLVGKI